MSKRKTIGIVLAVIVFIIIATPLGIYFFYKNRLNLFSEAILIEAAKSSNVNLSFEELSVSPLGVSAKQTNVFLQKAFLQLVFNDLKLRPKISSLLMMNPAVSLDTKLFESPVLGDAAYNISKKEVQANLSLASLQFSSLPQLAFFGVKGGEFGFDLKNFVANGNTILGLEGNLAVKNMSTGREFSIPTKLPNGGRQTLVIPPIEDFNISCDYLFKNDEFTINNGKITSDLGQAEYTGGFDFNPRYNVVSNLELDLNANLSAKSMQYFGYLLPEISNNMLSSSDAKFNMKIKGTPPHIKFIFTPRS